MFRIDKRKTIIEILFFVVALLIIVAVLYKFDYKSTVLIDGNIFSVEVVDTKPLLEKGLSGHAPLSQNQGMLFVFQKPDKYGFWMKDMLFPIDIVWIGANWRVIHIERNLSASTYPEVFSPQSDSLYVLEIPAGQSDSVGIKVGDKVTYL